LTRHLADILFASIAAINSTDDYVSICNVTSAVSARWRKVKENGRF